MAKKKEEVEIEEVIVPVEGDDKVVIDPETAETNSTEQSKSDDTVKSPPGNIR